MSIVILLFSITLLICGVGIIINKKGKEHDLQKISVVIVARNEEKIVPQMLESLREIDYPEELYEILLVDDCSRDNTGKLFDDFALSIKNVRVLKITEESKELPGKKEGLQQALEAARNDIILLTDADCLVRPTWLRNTSRYWDQETKMIVGYAPEDYSKLLKNAPLVKKLSYCLRRFSQITNGGIFAATIGLGRPFSCYGRNLALSREKLLGAGGYRNLPHNQSGDDKQILNLMNSLPGKIRYAPQRSVVTYPELSGFHEQQKRRFGKLRMSSSLYFLITILIIGFFIYLPVRVIGFNDYRSFFVFFLSAFMVWVINLLKHQERFSLFDPVFIIIYPYFMIYYTILGLKGDWQWKN